MRTRSWITLIGTLCVGTLLIGNTAAQEPSTEPPSPPTLPAAQEGINVMARGPVHEAYAESTEIRPQPSPLVTKQPPDPVNETPPDQKPEGDNFLWIPGYWSYDQDQDDFLWVSGFWRTPPPGRQWIAGAWQQVEGGWHWVSGFWAVAGQSDLQYLPTPPPTLDQGPSTPASQESSAYAPGCWVYSTTRYLWRPGFWVPHTPGWVWIPAHYLWTPAGCLFVEGYYDHPLEQRGLLFAPVRLAKYLQERQDWSYTPQYVVQPDFLLGALFVQQANCHYYFGDYFEDRYQRTGFVPWVDYRVGRAGFDPNFGYYRQQFAYSGTWERGLRGLYTARFRGEIARPPITLVQQNQVIRNITVNQSVNVNVSKNINITNVQNVSVLAPLTQIHNTRVTNLAALADLRGGQSRQPAFADHVVRLQALSVQQRAQQEKAVAQVHAIAQERGKSEARLLAEGPPVRVTDRPRQVKLDLPRTFRQPGPGSLPSETPRPLENVRPSKKPVPPVIARPGDRPIPPVTPRPETPRPPENVRPGNRPTSPVPPQPAETPRPAVKPPVQKVVPPPPKPPPHEDRPIPKHEPPKPAVPPRQVVPAQRPVTAPAPRPASPPLTPAHPPAAPGHRPATPPVPPVPPAHPPAAPAPRPAGPPSTGPMAPPVHPPAAPAPPPKKNEK